MFKALLRKQLSEVGTFLVQDMKSGKRREKRNQIGYFLILLLLGCMMLAIFRTAANFLCEPLVMLQLDWFYFAIMGLLAIILGVFASVFNTFSTLYLAKDNELLLAMPIPSWMILVARMLGVYVMGLVYESLVMLPTIYVYQQYVGFHLSSLIFSLLLTIAISIFILVLSCVLGWGVANISVRLKNKSFITVIASLVFIVAYYYAYSKITGFLQDIIKYGETYAKKFKEALVLFYHMGKAGQGEAVSFFLFAGVSVALLAICFLVLSKSFLKLATTNKGEKKKVIKEISKQTIKSKSMNLALFQKERMRFTSSANYMLNCGLGVVMYILLAGCGLCLIFHLNLFHLIELKDSILSVFDGNSEMIALILCGVICMTATMNDITAPSVSLEGKNLWILQTLPVKPIQIFGAKIKLQLIVSGVPAVITTILLLAGLEVNGISIALLPVIVFLFVGFLAQLGLILNLKMVNFNWTNEIAPIKQSASVTIALFGAWGIVIGGAVLYYFVSDYLSPVNYLLILTACFVLLNIVMYEWLKRGGVKVFESY